MKNIRLGGVVCVYVTVGLPARRLGGVFPKGDMLLRELLVLLVLGMCLGVVPVRLRRPAPATCGGRAVTTRASSSVSVSRM